MQFAHTHLLEDESESRSIPSAEPVTVTMRTSDSRLAHDRWRTWLPLGAVVLAVFALVALPLLRVVQVRPFNEEIRTLTEPSRTLLTRIHVALALEQSLLRDFIERSDWSR